MSAPTILGGDVMFDPPRNCDGDRLHYGYSVSEHGAVSVKRIAKNRYRVRWNPREDLYMEDELRAEDMIDAAAAADRWCRAILTIGRAQGLREAAGIADEQRRSCASRNEMHYYDCRQDEIERVIAEITAAADRAEAG